MKRTKYYHTDEVAKILKLSANEVRAMLVSKELKGFKRGRRWFINMDQPALEKAKVGLFNEINKLKTRFPVT